MPGESKCWTCFYYGWTTQGSCDFYLNTGVRRGCPADENCTRYLKRGGLRKGKECFSKGPLSERMATLEEEVRQRYERGMKDAQIAEELGVSESTISRWRRLLGISSPIDQEELET